MITIMVEIEKLDVNNIIEVKQIRGCLQHRPELLAFYEILLNCCNNKINNETAVSSMEIEDNDFDTFLCSDDEDELDTKTPSL